MAKEKVKLLSGVFASVFAHIPFNIRCWTFDLPAMP